MGSTFSKRTKAGVNGNKLPARDVDSAPAQLVGRIPSPPAAGNNQRLSDGALPMNLELPSPPEPKTNATPPPPPSHPPPKAKPPPPMPRSVSPPALDQERSRSRFHNEQASSGLQKANSMPLAQQQQPDLASFEVQDVNPIPEHAQHYLQVLNEPVVRGLFALMWGDRDESLKAIRVNLENPSFLAKHDKVQVWNMTVEILCSSLKDKVVPVYFSSLETLKTLFSALLPDIGNDVAYEAVNRLVPVLMHRVGNLNARIHTGASQTLMFLASERRIGPQVVGPYALAAFKKSRSQSNMYIGRLDLVQQMLKSFSSTQGLSVGSVMAFSAAALDSPDDKLRKAAVKVVCEVYRLQRMAGGDIDDKYLVNLKPAVLKKLQAKFAEIDGGAPVEGPASTSSARKHLAPLEDVPIRRNIPNGGASSSSSKGKNKPPRSDSTQHKKLRREDLPGVFSPGPMDESIGSLMATRRKPFNPNPASTRRVFDDTDEGLMNDILFGGN